MKAWASVVANGYATQWAPRSATNISLALILEVPKKEENCLHISTRGHKENEVDGDTFARYLDTDAAN